jgi:hypothetical protein
VASAADRAIFVRRAAPALEPVEVRAWARAACGVDPPSGGKGDRILLRDAPPGTAVDVVVDLSGRALPVGARREGRLLEVRGVVLAGGDGAAGVPATEAVLAGRTTVAFELEESWAAVGAGAAEAITRGVCPVHPSSPVLTEAYLGASVRQLVARLVENHSPAASARACPSDLRRPAGDAAGALPPGAASSRAARPLAERGRSSAAQAARVAARTVVRQVRKSIVEPEWYLLVGRQPAGQLLPDPRRLHEVAPPRGAYWADPHVVDYGGGVHVFFEEFDYRLRKGRIVATTLGADGVPGTPSVALEREEHLSYPSVFVHEGRLWMVPECAASGRLDLYECVEPPFAWVRRRTLLADAPLVDASIVRWEGRWWLFASLKKPAGLRTAELLLLYHTDDPVTGVWREHPLSPLRADVTNARPAGAPWPHDGRLYRLAQDGSRGYGSGLVINEVSALDDTRYRERRIAELRPTWERRLCGVHTLSRTGDVVAMDACRWARRELGRPRTDSLLD